MLHIARWKVTLILLVIVAGDRRGHSQLLLRQHGRRLARLAAAAAGGARPRSAGRRLSALRGRPRRLCPETPARRWSATSARRCWTIRASAIPVSASRGRRYSCASAISTGSTMSRKRLEPLRNPLNTTLLGGSSVYEFDLTVADDGLVRFVYSDAGLTQRVRGIVAAVDRGHQPAHQRTRHDRAVASSARATTVSSSRRPASATRSA